MTKGEGRIPPATERRSYTCSSAAPPAEVSDFSPSTIRHPHSAIPRSASRAGQAIVELVVGLVALLVVFVGILQIGRLAAERNRTLASARASAANYAMGPAYLLQLPGPDMIRDWDRGADQRSHSRDDRTTAASWQHVAAIVQHARPQDLDARMPGNPVTAFGTAGAAGGMDLVHGRVQSDEIPLLPVVRHLLYNAPSLRFEEHVWLVWCEGLR
ncbi:MAG TPA: hypothetical protein PKE12_11820 [Kiritimatiellia bacterium]|nr:hypothetical protein [Kiritimatiellia bacterium]